MKNEKMKVRSKKSQTSYFGLFIMKNSYFFLFNFLSYSSFLIFHFHGWVLPNKLLLILKRFTGS